MLHAVTGQFHRIVLFGECKDAIILFMNTKRLTVVFRALANANRLKVIKMLLDGRKMNVTEIAETLGISLKATSNHLAILKNLDVLEPKGTDGHVFYSLNPKLPQDFHKVIKIALH